jgi:hypothetical protein
MTPIPLTIHEPAGLARERELVRVGVPLPRGLAMPDQSWTVQSPGGERRACQTAALAAWPDGSVKWLLASFPASVPARETAVYHLLHGQSPAISSPELRVVESAAAIEVFTAGCTFRFPRRGERMIERTQNGPDQFLGEAGIGLRLVDRQGRSCRADVHSVRVAAAGPLSVQLAFAGQLGKTGLRVRGSWTIHAGAACAHLEVTLHNPARARHQRGLWDLGDPGSVLLRSLTLEVPLVPAAEKSVHWREEPAAEWQSQAGGPLEIVQQSSGGPHDDSRNHVSRLGKLPARGRGYRVQSATSESRGQRAEPILAVRSGSAWVAAGVAEFWQQFPKALSVEEDALRIGLFPDLGDDLHELQGGEQKTTRLAVSFADSPERAASDLSAVIAPLAVVCDGAWLAASGAIWRLPQGASRLRPEWQVVAEHAVAGRQGFFAKRETADEYGWRNFGDLWADHEEAYYQGPRPIVSHYNNQYDALEGFLLCYLLTGDRRWWQLADPLARHVIDIDIYHTREDKAAYNGGLFWHTNHYVDAATSTHRSYSAVNHPGGGGGPSNEHNYTSGLLLYYYLTGSDQARDAVIGLAEWVLAMDDGRRHLLGLVHETPTGLASKTSQFTYHGPGRGAGNSLNALLDGWLASGRGEFLVKLDELLRRTVHPHDDIAALDLGNAELRWSYTVFLQSLVRLVALSDECGLDAGLTAYARASLLHYARWMAEHEKFYLDEPEKLEFPTESWAAHELRKANVLTAAALYAPAPEAERFRTRARWFYDRAWSSLMGFATWHYTRPTVLALQLGLSAAQLAATPQPSPAPPADHVHPATPPERFVPQREAVRRALRSPAQLLAMIVRLGRVWRWPDAWRETWTRQQLRRYLGQFIG